MSDLNQNFSKVQTRFYGALTQAMHEQSKELKRIHHNIKNALNIVIFEHCQA